MVRKLTLVFALFAALVVAMGYVPQFITEQRGEEKMMFGLFMISLLDDITHGLTAVAAFAAWAHSKKASLLFLTAFGWYYALDAVFYLTYGLFNDKPWVADILLNLPHVIVSSVMLAIVYWWAPRELEAGPGRVEPARALG